MNELLKHQDLDEAYFYLYKADLLIKLEITDTAKSDDGVTIYLGDDSRLIVWHDTEVIAKKRPSDIIREFEWCYMIKNSDGVLGYIAK